MFYSEYVLAKKGALSKIWLAAHWEKKLTRNQISKSNIVEACQSIIKPLAPLALRTSAHLLIGVVRIHDGKQKSLMHDCSDALVKIKLAFRPGNVDLPSDRITANIGSITMAETLDGNFDDEFPGVGNESLLDETQFNIGTMEEITMVEPDYHAADIAAPQMDGFGEDAFNATTGVEGIEQGRDGDAPQHEYQPNDLTLDLTANNDTTMGGNSTVDMLPEEIPVDDLQIEVDDIVVPVIADDFGAITEVPIDETLQQDEQLLQPDEEQQQQHQQHQHLDDTIIENVSRIEMLDVSEIQPIDTSNTGPSVKLARRKRKLVVDEKAVEISNSEIRRGLDLHGPDDISKQPFTKTRGPFLFSRASHSMRGMKNRMQDRSPEALFRRPLSGVWGGQLLAVYHKSLEYNRDDVPEVTATVVDDIEVGRNVDPEVIDDGVNPHSTMLDETTTLEQQNVEPEFVDPVDVTIPLDDNNNATSANNNNNNDTNDVSAIGLGESRLDDFSILDDTTNNNNNNNNDDNNNTTTNTGAAIDSVFDTEHQVTSEEFETQDHLTKRTARMMSNLRAGFEDNDALSFEAMTHKKTKRVAAACLFELLVLKTKDYIDIDQPAPYADITVTPTELLTGADY